MGTQRSPLSGYEGRFTGAKGEPGAAGQTGVTGANGTDGVNGPAFVIIANKVTNYTLVLTDANVTLIEMDTAGANTLTVPPNSDVVFPIGSQVLGTQKGLGQTTVTAGAGVTILSASGNVKTTSQYSGWTLIKQSTNVWYLFGDLAS